MNASFSDPELLMKAKDHTCHFQNMKRSSADMSAAMSHKRCLASIAVQYAIKPPSLLFCTLCSYVIKTAHER